MKKPKQKQKTSDTTDLDDHELTFVNMYCSLFENFEYNESFGNCLEVMRLISTLTGQGMMYLRKCPTLIILEIITSQTNHQDPIQSFTS